MVFQELLLSETETPVFPPYLSSSLPSLEELFAVQVKHVVSPNEVRGAHGSSSGRHSSPGRHSAIGSSHFHLTDFKYLKTRGPGCPHTLPRNSWLDTCLYIS